MSLNWLGGPNRGSLSNKKTEKLNRYEYIWPDVAKKQHNKPYKLPMLPTPKARHNQYNSNVVF